MQGLQGKTPAYPPLPVKFHPDARVYRAGVTKVIKGKTPAKISGSPKSNWCPRMGYGVGIDDASLVDFISSFFD